MSWEYLSKTVIRIDAGTKPPGMVLRRVRDYMVTGIPNSCLDQGQIISKHFTMWFKHNQASFNGTVEI